MLQTRDTNQWLSVPCDKVVRIKEFPTQLEEIRKSNGCSQYLKILIISLKNSTNNISISLCLDMILKICSASLFAFNYGNSHFVFRFFFICQIIVTEYEKIPKGWYDIHSLNNQEGRKGTGLGIRQTEHIHGHMWRRYSLTVSCWNSYICFIIDICYFCIVLVITVFLWLPCPYLIIFLIDYYLCSGFQTPTEGSGYYGFVRHIWPASLN